MIASGLHVSTLRAHRSAAVFKLLLSTSHSMEVRPGFTESSVHGFWISGLHIYTPQGPGAATRQPSWKGSLQAPTPEMRVDLTVTFFDGVGFERADVYVEESESQAKSLAAQNFQRWPRVQGDPASQAQMKRDGGRGQGRDKGLPESGAYTLGRVPPPAGFREVSFCPFKGNRRPENCEALNDRAWSVSIKSREHIQVEGTWGGERNLLGFWEVHGGLEGLSQVSGSPPGKLVPLRSPRMKEGK